MAVDYLKMTIDTLTMLPPEKQEEVYDFANFLKERAPVPMVKEKSRKGSVLNIIGLGKSGISDVAINHDKYLYDE